MTAYANFIQDYPQRCKKLLESFSKNAKMKDLEVTQLLCISTSGIIVPYNRLSDKCHPAADSSRFKDAKEHFVKILDRNFVGSELWSFHNAGSWRFSELKNLAGDPDSWHLDTAKPIDDGIKISKVVKIMRNALAHGNIFTSGKPQIEMLVFLSRLGRENEHKGYNCLIVSPSDLNVFMMEWFKMLGNIKVPGEIFVETRILDTNEL